MARPAAWLTCGATLALCIAVFASNGSEPISTGARQTGRAGIDVAIADDGHAPNTNPAGMAFIDGGRFTGSLMVRTGDTQFENQLNHDRVKREIGLSPALGLVFDDDDAGAGGVPCDLSPPQTLYACPGCQVDVGSAEMFCRNCGAEFEPLALVPPCAPAPGRSARLRFGLGADLWGGSGGEARVRTPDFPEGFRTKSSTSVFALGPAMSLKLTPRFALGAGVYYLDARLRNDGGGAARDSPVQGKVFIYNPPDPPQPTDFTWGQFAAGGSSTLRVVTRDVQGQGWGFRLGMLYRINSRTSWGLTYRSRSYLSALQGKARIDANRTVETALAGLAPNIANFVRASVFPGGTRLGFASGYDMRIHDFAHPQRLATGLAHDLNGRLRLACEYTWIDWSSVFDGFKVTLSRGSNPDVSEFAGSSTTSTRSVLDWRDQHVLAAALEYRALSDLVLRSGWNYGESPAPRNTLSTTGGAIQEHHWTNGLTWERERWDLDLAVKYGLPTSATTAAVSRADANAENTRIKQYQLVFLFGIGYHY